MSHMVDAVEAEFVTDFALLIAAQAAQPDGGLASFARSAPGVVGMKAGTKYASIRIRAERWDARPPLTDEWEDYDELPFEEVPFAGRLMLGGFDPGEVGLDVSDLGRGRVEVLARGRHRYQYSADFDVDELDPEEWLLRLYPQKGLPDPLAGGPRRIAGVGGPSRPSGSPWLTAVLGYRSSGWDDLLGGSHGFRLANLALLSAEGPLSRSELAARMVRWMPRWESGGPDAETAEVPPRPILGHEPDPLATLSGRFRIATVGDAIDAMMAVGLLLVEERRGERLLVANPAPRLAWEAAGLTGERLARARIRALQSDHHGIALDIESAVGWAGDRGLRASPRSLALRWATTVEDVIGGLRMLGGSGRVASDRELGFDVELEPDGILVLRRGA